MCCDEAFEGGEGGASDLCIAMTFNCTFGFGNNRHQLVTMQTKLQFLSNLLTIYPHAEHFLRLCQ